MDLVVLKRMRNVSFHKKNVCIQFNELMYNHGKTKSATLQKRNVIFKAKTKCTKITEKATHLSGFFHLFKQYLNNIQKEQYIV